MNTYLPRNKLYEMINSGQINLDDNKFITCYPKSIGVLCTIHKCPNTDAIIVMNNDSEYIDSEFGKFIWDMGIRGEFIIRSDTNVRGITKWLHYNLNGVPLKEYVGKVTLYTRASGDVIKPTSMHVVTINPLRMSFDDLWYRINLMSRHDEFDGMYTSLIDVDGVTHNFYLVPNRYVNGKVLAVINDGGVTSKLIVSVQYQYRDFTVVADMFTIKMRQALTLNKVKVGDTITMQYTSFIGGHRLCNFASPIIVSVK